MKGDYSIPPLRDLPLGRLGQRREHLVFEITSERESRGALARLWPARWGRPGRRRVFALVAAALVVAVGTASANGSVRDFILDRGFVGVPPEGATPSSPEKGELVVVWLGRSATLPKQVVHVDIPCGLPPCAAHPLVRTWVYADGRIIWSRSGSSVPEGANELTSGYLEQRLTPEGVELVRSAVSRLFDRSRALLETVPAPFPGVGDLGSSYLLVPQDYGWGLVEVPRGDRLVRLAWEDDWGGDGKSGRVETIATPEQLSALRRVDALLTDPASVLPPSAWAVRKVRAYVPSHYAVCIDTSPPKDASQLLSLLPARAAELLRGKSSTSSEGDVVDGALGVLDRMVTLCYKLATEEAREVADALSGLDQDPRWLRHTLAYRVAAGAHDWEATAIWFEPYFPHGHYTYSASG
jgi:hypothetical protein